MSKINTIKTEMSEYWENQYKTNNIKWDIGGPTPVFNNWIAKLKKKYLICVLGSGNGWDAVNFAKYGHTVTAVDFAETAVNNTRLLAKKHGVYINILKENIFDLDSNYNNYFDIVLEYTCFCAIPISHRTYYIELVNRILKNNGELVALLFPIEKKINNNSPPYSIELNLTIKLFENYFTLIECFKSRYSIIPRKDKEIFVIFKKDANKN